MAVRDFVRVYRELYPTGTVGLEGVVLNFGIWWCSLWLNASIYRLIVFFIIQKWFIESVDRSE